MTYPWESSNSSSGGNILLIKIKIKRPAGQNLEIMTFRYLKALVKTFLKTFFRNYNIIWCFCFWGVLLVITKLRSLWLFYFVPPIYTNRWHDHQKHIWHIYIYMAFNHWRNISYFKFTYNFLQVFLFFFPSFLHIYIYINMYIYVYIYSCYYYFATFPLTTAVMIAQVLL